MKEYKNFQEYYEHESPKGQKEIRNKLRNELEKERLKHKIHQLKQRKKNPYVFSKKPGNSAKKKKFEDYIVPNYKKSEIKRREVIRKKASKNFDDFLIHM